MNNRLTAVIMAWSGTNEVYLAETMDSIQAQGINPKVNKSEGLTATRWSDEIALCDTEYLSFPHHDDTYLPDFYKETIGYLDSHPECAAVFTMDYIIDGNGRRTGMNTLPFPERDSYDFEFIFNAMLNHGNFLRCPSVVFRTKMVKGMRYPEECKTAADTAMWFQVLAKHPIGIINKQLYMYRQHAGSDTQKNVVGAGLQRFDHIDALEYGAKLKPLAVPWLWPFFRESQYAQREAMRDEIKGRSLVERASRVRFIVCHEAPENAGTGVLVSSRCRGFVSGDNDEVAVYVFPTQDAYRVVERNGLQLYKVYPVLPLHPQRFKEAIDKYKPDHIEFHHLLRWPDEYAQYADTVFLHDSYIWCATWHQVDSKNQPCSGSGIDKCSECVGFDRAEETRKRKETFKANLKGRVLANSSWLAGLAAKELGIEVGIHNWPVPEINRRDFKAKVGYFGSFSTVKGIDVIMVAATKMPDVLFVMFCEPPEQLKWMLDGRTVHGYPNILFCGAYVRGNMGSLVPLVDIVCVPSRCESWGLVKRECEMLGKKVVATDTGGLHGTVKPCDVNALVKAIREAI